MNTNWRRVSLAFVLAAVLALGGLTAVSGPASAGTLVQEKVQFDLTPTEATPGASGQGSVELRIGDDGRRELKAEAALEDMPQNMRFSLCLDSALLDDENADEFDNAILNGKLLDAQVTVITLDGIEVTLREGVGCDGTVLLSHTVTGSEAQAPEAQEARLTATVVNISGDVWRIGDFLVRVDASTLLEGDPGVGNEVEARALVQPDGSALATRIKNLDASDSILDDSPSNSSNEVRFEAIVMSISGDLWRIGDFMIHVDDNTRVEGEPGVGSGVEVRANAQPDGSALATLIRNLTPAAGAGAGSGVPGYGVPLTVSVPSTQLPLDRVGQVKEKPGELEVRDRQYEAEFGAFPVTINGANFLATEIKVISDLRVRDGVGQHQGTIDIDIDTIPGGHLTLEYRGSATVSGSTIISSGTFKVVKATDIFNGIRSEGSYTLTIVESGDTLGAPATVTFSASGT